MEPITLLHPDAITAPYTFVIAADVRAFYAYSAPASYKFHITVPNNAAPIKRKLNEALQAANLSFLCSWTIEDWRFTEPHAGYDPF